MRKFAGQEPAGIPMTAATGSIATVRPPLSKGAVSFGRRLVSGIDVPIRPKPAKKALEQTIAPFNSVYILVSDSLEGHRIRIRRNILARHVRGGSSGSKTGGASPGETSHGRRILPDSIVISKLDGRIA